MKIIHLTATAQFHWFSKEAPNEKHPFAIEFDINNYDGKIDLNIMASAWLNMRVPDEAQGKDDYVELLEIRVQVIEKEI